jgi:ribonucleoside-diphosphate reductase alpha chain
MTEYTQNNLYYDIYYAPVQYTYEQVLASSLEYFGNDELAASSFADKYALRDGSAEGNVQYVELTPHDMHKRIAAQFARIECNYKFSVAETNAILGGKMVALNHPLYTEWLTWYDYYLQYLVHFTGVVPQGSPMAGIGNRFINLSLSNCVVVDSPKDSWSSISDTSKNMGQLFKRRAGVGTDISNLRPEYAFVNNAAGSSTGAWSYTDFYSHTTRTIAQHGRRGACMISMHAVHPDNIKFTVCKRDPTRVTGVNISLLIMDDLMKAVENDTDFIAHWPVDITLQTLEKALNHVTWKKFTDDIPEVPILDDHSNIVAWKPMRMTKISGLSASTTIDGQKIYLRKMRAADLWFLICESALLTAEPGIILWETYLKYLPACCYPGFLSTAVNPCAEIALSPNDSCRILSNNLLGMILKAFTENASIDESKWKEIVVVGMRMLDNIVDLEIEVITRIIESIDDESEQALWSDLREAAVNGRRTGLGTHGLADCLAALGIKYDSDEAIKTVNHIYEVFRNTAYETSVNLAEERGAFPIFDWELEKDNAFIVQLPEALRQRMAKVGRRNISLLTNAPTGTVSIMSQTSSGIEPIFKLYYTRRRKINPSDSNARVDFVDQNKDKWQEYPVLHHAVEKYFNQNKSIRDQWNKIQQESPISAWAEELTALLPPYFVSANDVNSVMRVKIQGALQRYIDHGVSSTINLPRDTTVETISDIYKLAWKEGLKGVTVYVEGSRSGVLVDAGTNKAQPKGRESNEIIYNDAPKRPKTLKCDIHRASVDGKYWLIIVGIFNGKPYEVFGGEISNVDIPRRRDKGIIIKRKVTGQANAIYDLEVGDDDDDKIIVRNITQTFNNDDFAWATRQLSSELRHGVHPRFIVEQLRKSNTSALTHFSKAVARVLAKYIREDGEINEEINPNGDFCKSGSCE